MQFRDALQRVGVRLEKNLNWFIGFCSKNLTSLNESERQDLWHDLLALAVLATRRGKKNLGCPLGEHERRMWEGAASWPEYRWASKLPQKETLEYRSMWEEIGLIQEKVCRSVQQAIDGEPMLLQGIDVQVGLDGLIPIFPLSAMRPLSEGGTAFVGAEGAVLVRLAQVRIVHDWRIRRCSGCRTIFIAGRRDQRYCHDNCRAKAGMREIRARDKRQREQLSLRKGKHKPEDRHFHGKKTR